ncbi:arogenate dehydratase/prephenate dehydratase 6, chloroplastic isoform X1 [Physcomitrium patens]|uniref:Arogenate dehydratase n=1 Tax=Physcomitrium patens TaxID=3218 RepID=A0A2K1J547_PHYPA|nr:arogenate dehydratase/prephenate dehydratase 6, chloroplastic-like isoform X1 [Physcomitrium patens]PNR36654.1 hypothetical protein PHYPA_022505 [Physcomitrium patens]|eukprot:XP_024401444.1 arogenate dehydratase/prephenate dehydratase 6, chloroplastic-like isoform X1 [Physcomitrella patens]
MAIALCPAGTARAIQPYVGGFKCANQLEAAVCISSALILERRQGALANSFKRRECSTLVVRGRGLLYPTITVLRRAAGCVGQKGVLAVQDGSSPHVEEERAEQAWDNAGSPNAPIVPTSDLVSLQIPKPLSITDLALPPRHGSDVRVAYQGVPGAYSEAAAAKAYPRCEAVPCDQFEAAFQAVELWLVDRAVLPIENSLGGSIHRNYDLLLRHRLHIVGEVQLGVHHCLLGLPGVKKEELLRVVSHPQALAQCEHTLVKLGVAREAVDDTAGAAQFIAAHQLRDTGAVASARAAEIYGLEILMDGIQDDLDNVTRFLMLAREPIIPRIDRPFKTSIVFTLEEGPGVLFKALAVFALRSINLTKIESRPQRKRPLRVVDDSNNGTAKYFDYLFYVDFEASMADVRAQNALGHLQEFATFLRVLGSYPMEVSPMRA